MKFSTTNKKIIKIGKRQNKISDLLFKNKNILLKEQPTVAFNNKVIQLVDTEYFPFSSARVFGSTVSKSTIMNIFATPFFEGELAIHDDFIPYIKAYVVIKKPNKGKIVGVSVKNFEAFISGDPTITTLMEDTLIYIKIDSCDYQPTGSDTGDDGEVITFVPGLTSTLSQRNVDSENVNFGIGWNKTNDNLWEFGVGSTVMLEVPSEEVIKINNFEGNIVFTFTELSSNNFFRDVDLTIVCRDTEIHGEPPEPEETYSFYVIDDQRSNVSYDTFRSFEIDIEAKLVMFLDTRNIQNNKIGYTL